MYQLMFSVNSSILKDLTTSQGTGDIGFTSVLNSHSRRRELHPHLHIVVPNSGFDPQRKKWRKGKKGYLFNEFVLAEVWRARVFEAIKNIPTYHWLTSRKSQRNGLLIVKRSAMACLR